MSVPFWVAGKEAQYIKLLIRKYLLLVINIHSSVRLVYLKTSDLDVMCLLAMACSDDNNENETFAPFSLEKRYYEVRLEQNSATSLSTRKPWAKPSGI